MRVLKIAAATLLFATVGAFAQGKAPIKLVDVAELSGGGATVGTNWKNGIDLAVAEINAKGGILGRPVEVSHSDTQSNPGVARSLVLKALDSEPYALLGPGYSGSVKVTAPLAEGGRDRADHGRRGGGTDAGRHPDAVPHLVRPAILDAEDREIHRRRAEGEERGDRLRQQRFRQGRSRLRRQGIREARGQGRRRPLDGGRPGRLRLRRPEGQGGEARRRVPLPQRGGERAHPEGIAEAGRQGAARRRDGR